MVLFSTSSIILHKYFSFDNGFFFQRGPRILLVNQMENNSSRASLEEKTANAGIKQHTFLLF